MTIDAQSGSCLWGEDVDSLWETGCGHYHEFTDGGPADNAYLFCPFCGKQLEVLVYSDDDSDES